VHTNQRRRRGEKTAVFKKIFTKPKRIAAPAYLKPIEKIEMDKKKKFNCSVCGDPIQHLADLTVAGRIIAPFHNGCYQQARKKFPYKLSWKINGPMFWWLILGFNLLLTCMLLSFNDSWDELRWFYLVLNLSLLVPRLIAYFAYEKPLAN
jgi:hypothetical protein